MFRDKREERKRVFEDTLQMCKTDPVLQDSIKRSKERQAVIEEGMNVLCSDSKIISPAKIIVSSKRTLEAAQRYRGQRVCILNFASATNPGGGVAKGSNAQEEAICRCSTLYSCISDKSIAEKFHDFHRSELKAHRMNALYNDDCIYTPDVTVFKTDTEQPERMSEADWYQVDVISCAAPNLRENPSNAMNPGSGNESVQIKPKDLLELHKKRIRRIFEIAMMYQEEVLVSGAFGCGAFKNPPGIVSAAMASAVGEYRKFFKVIEFAVFCPPRDRTNYEEFQRNLARFK